MINKKNNPVLSGQPKRRRVKFTLTKAMVLFMMGLVVMIGLSIMKSYFFAEDTYDGYDKKVTLIGSVDTKIGGATKAIPVSYAYCSNLYEYDQDKELLISQALARTKQMNPSFIPSSIEVTACAYKGKYGAYRIKKKDKEL